ncbi:MAG: hypothetical protein JKY96_08290 [Phycisphaerales bacterium]|nr:hypothetical protein [Phycisphaerales bacterium]
MSTVNTQQSKAIEQFGSSLRATGIRARGLLIARALAWTLAALLAALTLVILADFALRLPMGIRVILLAAMLMLGLRLVIKLLVPALRARFSQIDLALRVESIDESSRGMLAGAIDLQNTAAADPTDPIEAALRSAAIARATARVSSPPSILRIEHALRAAGALLLIGLVVMIPAIRSPALTSIGIQRAVAPWSNASWPKRFAINDATPQGAHAIDEALRVRVSVSPSTSDAHAIIRWRVLDENNRPLTPSTRTLLAAQPIAAGSSGRVYESLLDTRALGDRTQGDQLTLEYRIETTLAVTPPPYAVGSTPSVLLIEPDTHTTESQFITDPLLAGSQAMIRWSFSKPIELADGSSPHWLASISDRLDDAILSQPTDTTLELRFTASDSVLIEPTIVDHLGITVRKPIALDLVVHTDTSPSTAIVEPDRDIMVTARATIALNAQFLDDIGLGSAWIWAIHAAPPADSTGAMPEPSDAIELVRAPSTPIGSALTLEALLEVSIFNPNPGDELWITAQAIDLKSDFSGSSPVTSESRILRIVDELTMIEHLQRTIAPVLEALKRLDEQQSTLQDQLESGLLESSRDQRSLAEQIRSQQRVLARAEQIASTNAIDDPSLRSLLQDSDSTLAQAAQAADNAADGIDQNREEFAKDEQQTVRDRLGQALSMLDRGKDSWLARRSVQELRDEIQRLKDQTDALNATAAGKSIAELSADERTTLEKILDRQRETAERARAMLDELDERAAELQETDPTQAEALRRAAAQGRGSQIEQTLKQASDEIAGNQTGQASQSQQAAMDELDSMLDEIDHASKNRDSALRRQLASIIEQLETLIAAQSNHLTKLRTGADGLDISLIGLIENTLGVRDTATGAFPETQTIADHLTKAADTQSMAVTALRVSPVDLDTAEQQERNALHHIEQALDEAQRLNEQAADRESRRLRDELRKKYQEALDAQVQIRDQADPFSGTKLTRKERSDTRAIARTQDELRTLLDELISESEELAEASVFALTHSQLDRVMNAASKSLNDRTPPESIRANHFTAIHMLSALVEVLQDAKPKDEMFEDGQSGGGSGSGQSGQEEPVIPPIAQLKLLRSLQQLAAMQTQSLNDSPAADPKAVRALVDLQQEIAAEGQQLIEQLNEQQGDPKPNKPVLVKPRDGSLQPSDPGKSEASP